MAFIGRLTLLGAIGAVMLAACDAGLVRTGAMEYSSLYEPNIIRYAVRTGELRVVVRGNPFGAGTVDGESIAKAFYMPGWIGPVRTTTQPGPETPHAYAIVLLFNPDQAGPGGDDTCRDSSNMAAGGGGGPIRVQATFCFGPRWVSTLVAEGPPAKSPQDPAFHHLMDQVGYDLFPPYNPKNGASPSVICRSLSC